MKAVYDKVIIEKYVESERIVDGIVIPMTFNLNTKLQKGKILSVGPEVKKYNIKEGDYVLYDKLSAYDDTKDIIVTKVENVILKIGENNEFI